MKTYIYPQNLKAASRLWLWSIKDFLIICIGLILSVVILTQIWSFIPFGITAMFAFLSIRMEETTIMDYIFCAFCDITAVILLEVKEYEESKKAEKKINAGIIRLTDLW